MVLVFMIMLVFVAMVVAVMIMLVFVAMIVAVVMILMVFVATIVIVVMMVFVVMIVVVVMLVLMGFSFITYVYRGLFHPAITIDNKVTIKTQRTSDIVCINAVHCLICSLRILFLKI